MREQSDPDTDVFSLWWKDTRTHLRASSSNEDHMTGKENQRADRKNSLREKGNQEQDRERETGSLHFFALLMLDPDTTWPLLDVFGNVLEKMLFPGILKVQH